MMLTLSRICFSITMLSALVATPAKALDPADREQLREILAAWSDRASQSSQIAYDAIATTEYHEGRSFIYEFFGERSVKKSINLQNLTAENRLKFVIEPEANRWLSYGVTRSPNQLGNGLGAEYVRLRAFDGEKATVYHPRPQEAEGDQSRMVTYLVNGERSRAWPRREWVLHAALSAHGRVWCERMFDYEMSGEGVIDRYNMTIGGRVKGPSGENCISILYNPIRGPFVKDEEIHCDVDNDYRIVYRSYGSKGKTLLDYALRYETEDASRLTATIRWFEIFDKSQLGRLKKTTDVRYQNIDGVSDFEDLGQYIDDFMIQPVEGSWVQDMPTRVVSKAGPSEGVNVKLILIVGLFVLLFLVLIRRRLSLKSLGTRHSP